jgi:lipopolysaccharide transport system permease protein
MTNRKDLDVTIYDSAENKNGFFYSLKKAYTDLKNSRHIIFQLFKRDFISQFKQKILGYLWALINPLISIINFLFLYFVGVLSPGEGEIPYTIYVFVGSTIWGCLPGSMAAVSNGLQAQADLIMRTRIPKIALAVSSLAIQVYGIFISMFTMLILFYIMDIKISFWFLTYPILVLPMILLGAAMGLVLSILGAIAKDLTAMITPILQLFMYITPVVYMYSNIKNIFVKKLIVWNPLTYLIDFPRSLICLGQLNNLDMFMYVFMGVIILVIISLRIFYLLEDLVAERL